MRFTAYVVTPSKLLNLIKQCYGTLLGLIIIYWYSICHCLDNACWTQGPCAPFTLGLVTKCSLVFFNCYSFWKTKYNTNGKEKERKLYPSCTPVWWLPLDTSGVLYSADHAKRQLAHMILSMDMQTIWGGDIISHQLIHINCLHGTFTLQYMKVKPRKCMPLSLSAELPQISLAR